MARHVKVKRELLSLAEPKMQLFQESYFCTPNEFVY